VAKAQAIDELIAGVGAFAGLDRPYLELIAGCGSTTGFDAGTYLFREGDPADNFFIVRRGRIALEVFAPGRGQTIVATLGPGELVGWSWLFPPYRWHFDGRAVERVRALAFDAACLRGKCDADHTLGYELMQRFASSMLARLQATRLQLLDVYGSTAG
jgi:CRP-like cAMP-binding protein